MTLFECFVVRLLARLHHSGSVNAAVGSQEGQLFPCQERGDVVNTVLGLYGAVHRLKLAPRSGLAVFC